MTRRAPLPMITECVEKQKQVGGIGRRHLLRAAYPFAVVCLLCLAHVHLQFSRVDLQMQQSQLQGQRRLLIRQEQILVRQYEAMCDPESLKAVAVRDLKMQRLENPTSDLLASVPQDLKQKYTAPLDTNANDVMIAELRRDRQQPGLQDVLLSLFDSSRAIASPANGTYKVSKF